MSSVGVNPPKTPVTKGSNGLATATLPNICKMPGPPAPFVPTPLPNIGQSGKTPQGYSTTVKIEKQPVAIQGASFGSTGDIASKGTGGGIVSSNAEGPTKFVSPGSMDVKIEGKNVQLLGDMMLNNCGPSGSPPNSATMAGELQDPSMVARAASLGVLAELQEVCDTHCECKSEGDNTQMCIHRKISERDAASGFKRRLKSEVPYKMDTKTPIPYMSEKEPWRQTRNWFRRGSRRPDVVLVADLASSWSGENIAAVIECKWKGDTYNQGQKPAYERIAGGKEKFFELNDDNCTCPDDDKEPEPEPVPVPLAKPLPERDSTRDLAPNLLRPLAGALALVGLAALAVAAAASAPVTATAAVAVAAVGLLGVGSTDSAGGGDVI